MQSMTGYASHNGFCTIDGLSLEWDWELRAVNGRGLEIRVRIPEAIGFLEKKLKDQIAKHVARGTISLALRVKIDQAEAVGSIDKTALETVLKGLAEIEMQAREAGVVLTPPTALDLLAWRGIQAAGRELAVIRPESLEAVFLEDLDHLLASFCEMRGQEGESLAQILAQQIDEVVRLTTAARALQSARADDLKAHFHKALAQVTEATRADPTRLEQELAILAVKADIAEELDRLDAHSAAARALLKAQGAVGRKLEFLIQEFNREANTLCSKAQHLEMTRIGLDLKAVIDQMREQIQNVE